MHFVQKCMTSVQNYRDEFEKIKAIKQGVERARCYQMRLRSLLCITLVWHSHVQRENKSNNVTSSGGIL